MSYAFGVPWGADSIEVGLNLHFLSLRGTWKPNDDERRAAWELYVELATRIAVVPLGPNEGLMREALSSLYALFPITRDILRTHGPVLGRPRPNGEYNFAQLAVVVLNYELRPLLAHWHPALETWEAKRPTEQSRAEHESAWPAAAQLRADLEQTRERLVSYADLLAAAGVPPLAASPTP